MADFRFKDLTVDNAFDFCEVLAVIGVEQVIGAFDKDEIQKLQESGTNMKEVGIVIAMKVCGILIKNISKARNEICKFFANCMEWDNGTVVTADDIKKFKLKQFAVMVKDFAKRRKMDCNTKTKKLYLDGKEVGSFSINARII